MSCESRSGDRHGYTSSAVPVTNPLSALDDRTLWNAQLLIAILCQRKNWNQRKKRTANLCELGTALQIEADLRGVPSPHHPYHVGDVR